MTTTSDNKLSRHSVWLFAFGSIAAGIGVSYALQGLGTKVTAAVYFAIVAIGAFLSTYLTKAKTGGAILAFTLGSVAAAAGYFALVSSITTAATTTLVTAAGAGSATNAADAATSMGHAMGGFVAAIVFLETFIAGLGGSIAGARSRGQGGWSAIASAARASQ